MTDNFCSLFFLCLWEEAWRRNNSIRYPDGWIGWLLRTLTFFCFFFFVFFFFAIPCGHGLLFWAESNNLRFWAVKGVWEKKVESILSNV